MLRICKLAIESVRWPPTHLEPLKGYQPGLVTRCSQKKALRSNALTAITFVKSADMLDTGYAYTSSDIRHSFVRAGRSRTFEGWRDK